jgi:hypothetical protein
MIKSAVEQCLVFFFSPEAKVIFIEIGVFIISPKA